MFIPQFFPTNLDYWTSRLALTSLVNTILISQAAHTAYN